MKNYALIIGLAALFTGAAFAADNYLGSIQTDGSRANCLVEGQAGRKLAVQCKSAACHVAAASLRDGGGSSLTGGTADPLSVLVNQNVLYDVDMASGTTPFICVIGQDGGAVRADVYVRTVLQ